MKVSFTAPDASMPRTVYYDAFAAAVRRNSRFVAEPSAADLFLPAEDVALETNWPRYGNPASAFIRGGEDRERLDAYCETLFTFDGPLCMVNMHPLIRVPQKTAAHSNITVADINLSGWERLFNPRTISMPALPITMGPGAAGPKTILASFRGVASHPCRIKLRAIHDGAAIRCELVATSNHVGHIDASTGKSDTAYADLLADSIFAFVPRGDAMFSYRLLEAMSFGCIPVILSDNWVPPFDRTVPWNTIALHMSENNIGELPRVLSAFDAERIGEIQRAVIDIYRTRFMNLDLIVETLFQEIEAGSKPSTSIMS